MMASELLVKEWLIVQLETGVQLSVGAHELGSIDAAVSACVDSGYSRDTLLHLDGFLGEPIALVASQIIGWELTTPETRARQMEQEAALDAEAAALRAELGLFD